MRIRRWLLRWLQQPSPTVRQSSFETAVAHYEAELTALEQGKPTPLALLELLSCRDKIAAGLVAGTVSPQSVQRLAEFDHRLSKSISKVPKADWDAWRKARNPPADYWWWRLDEHRTQAEERRDLLWVVLAGTMMTVALGWTVEIIRRLWSGGGDWLSSVVVTVSLLLTGSPLTRRGPELAKRLFSKIHRLTPHYQGEAMAATAAIALLAVLGVRFFGLPVLALHYNNQGGNHLRAGELTQSHLDFQRAVSLNPDYAEAYYNLADAYVETGDYDQACSLYQRALAANRTLDLAYNGLGYALILRGELDRAVPILYTGLSLAQDDKARIVLWTNLGRAYLEAQRYYEAEDALAQALVLNPEEAAAHCMLALAAEAVERPNDEVILQWERCLGYAVHDTPRERELAAMARSHLRSLEEAR